MSSNPVHPPINAYLFVYRLPLSTLAPTLFPFFRHTIPNVRLAVVKTLHSFMAVSSLPRDWIAAPFLRLLFQNLIVEERADIREATLVSWRTAVTILHEHAGWLASVASEQLLFEWYAIIMTPLGVAIDLSNWFTAATDRMETAPERHNVDKNMLSQDLSLVTIEITLKARVAAATALANLIVYWPTEVSLSLRNQRSPPSNLRFLRIKEWKLSSDQY